MAPGLFWFFLGAGAATYYIDKKQTQKNILDYPQPHSPHSASNYISCTHDHGHGQGQGPAFQAPSPPIPTNVQQAPPLMPVQQSQQQVLDTAIPGGGSTTDLQNQRGHEGYAFRRWSWGGMGARDEPFTHTQTQTQAQGQAHDQTQGQVQAQPFPWHHHGWDDERAKMKMREFGRRADDVMTDLSDATLDALTTTVELLRDKLAEHRIQREQAKGQGLEQGEGEKTIPGYV